MQSVFSPCATFVCSSDRDFEVIILVRWRLEAGRRVCPSDILKSLSLIRCSPSDIPVIVLKSNYIVLHFPTFLRCLKFPEKGGGNFSQRHFLLWSESPGGLWHFSNICLFINNKGCGMFATLQLIAPAWCDVAAGNEGHSGLLWSVVQGRCWGDHYREFFSVNWAGLLVGSFFAKSGVAGLRFWHFRQASCGF